MKQIEFDAVGLWLQSNYSKKAIGTPTLGSSQAPISLDTVDGLEVYVSAGH